MKEDNFMSTFINNFLISRVSAPHERKCRLESFWRIKRIFGNDQRWRIGKCRLEAKPRIYAISRTSVYFHVIIISCANTRTKVPVGFLLIVELVSEDPRDIEKWQNLRQRLCTRRRNRREIEGKGGERRKSIAFSLYGAV